MGDSFNSLFGVTGSPMISKFDIIAAVLIPAHFSLIKVTILE